MVHLVTRRQAIVTAAGLTALATTPPTDAGTQTKAVTRIAFGSCAHQDKEQPVWDTILATKPDLFIFLGDNIYGDTRDIEDLRAKYAKLAQIPGFKRLRETVPVLAAWDDHDFGENDAGADYPLKDQSKQAFLEFWNEPPNSARWKQDGIYDAYVFGPAGQRVQIILPDLRTNRTAIRKRDLGGKDFETWATERLSANQAAPGPYERNSHPSATMLGASQWHWLEQQMRVPAEVRLFGSSLQVLADFPGWEAWINYAHDHQRLFDLIRRTRCSGMVFLSGDTHYAELSRLNLNTPYPLWDLTSSGITEVWPVLPPNDNRVGRAYRGVNFGVIDIQWAPSPILTLQVRDIEGTVRVTQDVNIAELAVA